MNGIGQFFGQFLARNFHLGLAETGRVLSLVAGTAMPCGMLLGGFGIDWAARRDKRWFAWGPAVTLVLASPAFILGFSQPTVLAAALVLAVAHICLFVYWTPTLALAQNLVGASMRASSMFVFNFVIGLVGIGFGPTLVGSSAIGSHGAPLPSATTPFAREGAPRPVSSIHSCSPVPVLKRRACVTP